MNMTELWWKLRFCFAMWRASGVWWWDSAIASYENYYDEDPVDSAHSEMSYWEDDGD